MEDIAFHLHKVYEAWSNASVKNMIDEHFGDFDHWFEQYYSAVVSDCLSQANEDVVFHDKYMALPVKDQDNLKSLVNDYIIESKEDLRAMLTLDVTNKSSENDSDMEIDTEKTDEDIDMDIEDFDFDLEEQE